MPPVPKKPALGNGKRFAALKDQLSKKPSGAAPNALAAFDAAKKKMPPKRG